MNRAKTTASFKPLRGSTDGALVLAIERFKRRLWYAARVLAGGDRDLAKDFYQAAITQLWELDPARFDEDDDGYLWRSMMNRMLNAQRGEGGDPMRSPLALRFP